jgi:hypothetical protein
VNPRTTGVVFLVAAVLAAFVYFYEIRGEDARLEAEQDAKRLFPGVEVASIASISLTTSDGVAARLERRDGVWELALPLRFPADNIGVDGMASALVKLTSEAVYEDPQALSVYGLDAAEPTLRFHDGTTEHALRLGDKTPVGGNSYVQVEGDPKVYAIPTFSVRALTKTLDDLRDKRIADFDRTSIDRITAAWPGGRVVLVRAEEEWRIEEPIEGRAELRTVEDLLTDLSFLRATGFVDDPPPDAEIGLAPPAFSVILEGAPENEGAEPVTRLVAIGDTIDGSSRLVRGGQPSLYRIPAERIADFPRELVAYRFKQLADFPLLDAVRVEIEFRREGRAPLVIEATRGDAGWTSSPERFRPGVIASLVSELANLRATNILADAMGSEELAGVGLSPPNAVVRVYGEPDGEEVSPLRLAEIHVGVLHGASGIVARVEGDATIYELPLDLAEHIPVSLEAFENRFRAEEEPEPAEDTSEDASIGEVVLPETDDP